MQVPLEERAPIAPRTDRLYDPDPYGGFPMEAMHGAQGLPSGPGGEGPHGPGGREPEALPSRFASAFRDFEREGDGEGGARGEPPLFPVE